MQLIREAFLMISILTDVEDEFGASEVVDLIVLCDDLLPTGGV